MREDANRLLDKHRLLLEGFAEDLLRPYIASLDAQQTRIPTAPKVLNDPVWGSIVLYPLELVILDSPLLQRLRRIRQLGVAHWVYPGAAHSRFEHTLGVIQQTQLLVDAINAAANPEVVRSSLRKLLRVAALLHDIGDGVMSHVAENAFRNLGIATDIQLAFADDMVQEDVPLSEIAAYFMVGSPAMKELFAKAIELTNDHDLPMEPVRLIQNTIIGKAPIDNAIPLVHELITGPFDADKLDYMARDAQMSGVPVVTDVRRLVNKIRAVEVSTSDLPQEVARLVPEAQLTAKIIGVDLSGGRTIDELMLGRTLLFDKIYRHHKVRAAEAMVASILKVITAVAGDQQSMVPYLFTDEQLIDLTHSSLEEALGRELSTEEQGIVAVAIDLAERLRNRNLFVRCFAFAQSMPLDLHRSEEEQRLGLEELLRVASDPIQRGELVNEIVDATVRALALSGRSELLANLANRDLKAYVWMSPPDTPTRGNDIPRAYLLTGERGWLRFSDDAAETRGWADAYLLTRDVGYVFAPHSLATFVFLAAEKTVREHFSVRIPTPMLAYAKQDPVMLDGVRQQLADAGYYDGSPVDLKPLPPRLGRADVAPRLRAVAERLSGYHGPLSE